MKHVSLFVLLIFNGWLYANAQSDSLYIWPAKVPHAAKPKASPVPVTLDDGSIRVIEVTDPFLAIFLPSPTLKNGKAVLVCPGGGYVRLAVHKEGYSTADWLSSLGYTVFVLHYSVPNQRDGALQDIQRALRLIRNHATKYQIKTDSITAVGFSAGAHLIARASMGKNLPSYPQQDEADQLSAKPNNMVLIYPAYLNVPGTGKLQKELQAHSETINTFIFQTMDDSYVSSAFAIATALREVKANIEMHILPTGGHGYGLSPGNIAAETWPALLEAWLNRQGSAE